MDLPLKSLKVLEFTHAVMGPTTGLLLADLGAEVIHIEPPHGDETRRLKGFGTGYFPFYSRNKKSLAVDIKSDEGKEIIYSLLPEVDVVVENFGPGTMDRLGYAYQKLVTINPRLIYCSLKGFLKGPYENRHAMDEVVQMMGGLAYMTGRPGDPLRAGTSVVDITGGMFGFIGIMTALYEREKTGLGKEVKASLFETTAFLMGQHMAYSALSQAPIPPMPARISAWSVYQIFATRDDKKIFIGIISDKHWQRFCNIFGWHDWLHDNRLATNGSRIDHRDWLLPLLENRIKEFTINEIIEKCEQAAVPFSPIARPEDLFNDPHLNQGHSLLATTLPNNITTKLPGIPVDYGGIRPPLRLNPPKIGEHTKELLLLIGKTEKEIGELAKNNIITT